MDAPLVHQLFRQEHGWVANVRTGEPLKASKRESHLEMSAPGRGDTPRRFLREDQVDRWEVEAV